MAKKKFTAAELKQMSTAALELYADVRCNPRDYSVNVSGRLRALIARRVRRETMTDMTDETNPSP